MYRSILGLLIVGSIALGCGPGKDEGAAKSKLSERERDSVIGASQLPGAKVVKKGLDVSDSVKKHVETVDTLSGEQ